MKLKELFKKSGAEVLADAAECMTDRLSDADKAGRVLSMIMKGTDYIEKVSETLDTLEATNQKLLEQNKELLNKLEDIQKANNTMFDSINGLYGRIDRIDEKIELIKDLKKCSKKED